MQTVYVWSLYGHSEGECSPKSVLLGNPYCHNGFLNISTAIPTVTMQYKTHKTQPVVSKYRVFEDQLRLWDTTRFAIQCCFSGSSEPCSLGWAALPQLASSWKWDRSRWTWGDFGEIGADVQDLEKVIDDYREADT